MGKSTLKLTGVYEAWSRNVRQGRLTRANGAETPVLVRVDDVIATPELLQRLREDTRLLGRLQHESVLRIEHVTAVGGKVGVVHEGFECASASRILRVLRARNQVLPARAAVEAAAAVGLALDHALRIVDGDRSVHHPSPSPEDVLVDISGHVKLAGFRVARPGDAPAPPPRGYAAPEGGSAPPAATYLVGALLVELLSGDSPPDAGADPERHEAAVRRALIRVLARPGDTPGEPVVAAIRQALAHDPAVRGGPGAFGSKLRELAVALQSPGLRAWAPGSIPSIQTLVVTPAEDRAGTSPQPFPTDESRLRPPLGPFLGSVTGPPLTSGQTLAPLDASLLDTPRPGAPSPSSGRSLGHGAGTIVPPADISEELLHASPPRSSAPAFGRGAPPMNVPSSGLSAPPPARPPAPPDGALGGPPLAVTRSTGAPRIGVDPSRDAGPLVSRAGPDSAALPGPAAAQPPRGDGPSVAASGWPGAHAPNNGPALEHISDGDASEATVSAGHRPAGPSVPIDQLADDAPRSSHAASLSPAGLSSTPSRSVFDDDEPVASGGVGRLFLAGALGLAALVAIALVIGGVGLYLMRPGIEEVEVVAPAAVVPPVEAPAPAPQVPEPPAPEPSTPASVPAVPPAAASVPAPPPSATSTKTTSSAAATPVSPPSSSQPTPAPAVPVTRTPPRASPSPASPPEAEAPVRISTRPSEPAPAAAPAAALEPVSAAVPAPAGATGWFQLKFQSGDPTITNLEVRCVGKVGSGAVVALDTVPSGNCRVTGRGSDAPLITMVTVVADRSYTCFTGRTPVCK